MMKEKLIELTKHLKSNHHSRFETYHDEVTTYLLSKFADYEIPAYIIMDVAQYATYAAYLVTVNEVNDAFKDWKRLTTKGSTKLRNSYRDNETTDEVSQ